MAKGLTIPPDLKEITSDQLEFVATNWNDTFDTPFDKPEEIYRKLILQSPTRKDIDLTFKETVSKLAQDISDSTSANKDSIDLWLSGIFYETHQKIQAEIDAKSKNDDEIAGAMISMEDARKMLAANEYQKEEQFSRIKAVYKMDDTTTYDQAYERLLKDLSADELSEIQKTGQFLSKDPYGGVPSPGVANVLTTGKETKGKIEDYRNMLMPTPLHEQSDPGRIIGSTGFKVPYVETDSNIPLFKMLFGEGTMEMPFPSLWGYGNPNVKMNEERFKGYLAWQKLKEIETEYKNSTSYDYARGKGIDWEKSIEASNKYAEANYKEEYKNYVSYQKEILKDVSSPALDQAISRLESDVKVEKLLQGI